MSGRCEGCGQRFVGQGALDRHEAGECQEIPDSKTYPRALYALARDGVLRGRLSMSRPEAFVLWWLALGAGLLGVTFAPLLAVTNRLRRQA